MAMVSIVGTISAFPFRDKENLEALNYTSRSEQNLNLVHFLRAQPLDYPCWLMKKYVSNIEVIWLVIYPEEGLWSEAPLQDTFYQ